MLKINNNTKFKSCNFLCLECKTSVVPIQFTVITVVTLIVYSIFSTHYFKWVFGHRQLTFNNTQDNAF